MERVINVRDCLGKAYVALAEMCEFDLEEAYNGDRYEWFYLLYDIRSAVRWGMLGD